MNPLFTNSLAAIFIGNKLLGFTIQHLFCTATPKEEQRGIAAVWQEIGPKKEKVIWHRLLWSSLAIPRHSIIVWMAIVNRLPTMSRLTNLNPNDILIKNLTN